MKKTKEERKANRDYKRHVRIWHFLHFLTPVIRGIYKFDYEKPPKVDGSYLVLANHTTNLDPVLLGVNFWDQMYFVASEHIYRKGFASKILRWAFEPIAKMKGSTDTLTVMKAIRSLREGKNVCIFAEGNRTFNGRSDPKLLTAALGKLVKASAANLMTYRLEGGYFAEPRWGFTVRKGKVLGHVVNVYTKEQLKEMTPEQIVECVAKDIDENAYTRQAANPIKYKGRRLAEGLECAVCVCPYCNSIGKLTTKKNTITCSECNESTVYTPYGYFADGFKFHTIEEWDDWQEEFYKDYLSKITDNDSIIFCDDNITLNSLTQDHESIPLGTGNFAMYRDRFEFTAQEKTTVIPFANLPDMSIFAKTGLVFKDEQNGIHYEFKTDRIVNVRKYLSCWKILKA